MKKVVRNAAGILSAAVLVASAFGGCNAPQAQGQSGQEQSGAQANSDVNVDANSSEAVSAAFIEALISSDFDTALSCLGLEEGESFLTAEDIEFSFPRSSFSDIQGLNLDEYQLQVQENESTNPEIGICVVDIIEKASDEGNAEESVTVYTKLSDDNKWIVDAEDFYYTNYTFRTSGGDVDVFVNGMEVSDELCTNNAAGGTGLGREFTLPYVGKKEIDVEITCDNYEYTTTLVTSSNNEVTGEDRVYYTISSEDQSKCAEFVKSAWNGLCEKYESGGKATDAMSYLASSADSDICNQIWDGLESCHKNGTAVESDRDDNFNFTQCKPTSGAEEFWMTDDKVIFYFDYELTWEYMLINDIRSMKRQSNIILEKEGDNFKIYQLTDSDLFAMNSNFTSEW